MLQFLAEILRPLSIELSLAAIVAGLIFGYMYHGRLRLSDDIVYHNLISVWGFILLVFLFRVGTQMVQGATVSNPAGWIGVALLFGLYCIFVRVGKAAHDRFVSWRLKRKFRV